MPRTDRLLNDRPISKADEDILARGPFARLVAEALLSRDKQGANVVGLVGAWGTGKSSVANMATEAICQRATVVAFEPWMVSSKEALAHEFFRVLMNAILPHFNDKDSDRKRARLYKYGSKVFGVISSAATVVGTCLPAVGLGAKASKGIELALKDAGEGLEALATEQTLRESKEEICRDLTKLKTPVVIVVDDVDRLDKDEVRTIFQLIKACADFPNISYLLLYDRVQVEFSLAGSVSDPAAFLEKIVNQCFDLPEATAKQRAELLDAAIDELGIHSKLAKPGRERLSMAFDNVLLPGLTSVRQVKRFVKTVRSMLPGVVVDGFLNIDPADFLVLEYLRQYIPPIYTCLREEEAPKPGGRFEKLSGGKDWEDKVKNSRAAVVETLVEPSKSLANAGLRLLASGISGHSERRFYTDYWKPVYLGFCDARATVRETDWVALKILLHSGRSTADWLGEWDDRERRDRWVHAISARAHELSRAQKESLLRILFAWGDLRVPEQPQFFNGPNVSWSEAVRYCTNGILRAVSTPAKRVEMLASAIEKSGALIGPSLVVGMESSHQRDSGWGHWSDRENMEGLVLSLQSRLTPEIESGRFWLLPDPTEARHAWLYLVERSRSEAWFAQLIADPQQLANYVNLDLGAQRGYTNPIDWGTERSTAEAIKNLKLSLLTPNGKWARDTYIKSSRRADFRDGVLTANDLED